MDLSVAPSGGAGTYAAGFAAGLVGGDFAERDQLVVLVDQTWAREHEDLISGLEEVGITVDAVAVAAPGTWAARLQRGSVARQAVARHGVQVAYFPRDLAPRVGCATALLANNLYAWQGRVPGGSLSEHLSIFLLRRAAHRSVRRAAAVLAVSGTMAAVLPADVEVASVVHHGCSLDEHLRVDDGEPEVRVVAMFCNVMAHKGIDVVIDGVSRASVADARWELRVHGGTVDLALVERLERQAREQLGASVLRCSLQGDDLAAAYRQAHVVVVGGTFESFCLPLVEAMRTGCVVVAPASDLVLELCGDIAVTYEEGDAASLARALEVAWEERHDRRARGVIQARSFTWERAVEQTLGVVRAAGREC